MPCIQYTGDAWELRMSNVGLVWFCWYRILSVLDLHAGPLKNPKISFSLYGTMRTSRMTWRNPFEHWSTWSVFFAKMTKMALISPRFDQRSNVVRTLTKQRFLIVLHQTWVSQRFLTTLTKFDLVDSKLTPRKPNFDQAVRTGWNQCHCEDYQILNSTTIHGSKLELEQSRYHKNLDNARSMHH